MEMRFWLLDSKYRKMVILFTLWSGNLFTFFYL
jgi:hypothetical protein